ncbi:Ferritin [Candidatus Ornithobacterium hominis]|uniref:ferritin n=1 Tax=Candidatus Ornithobacterium hominis TaxID=2497989 RepID=UPI000E5BD4CA|nr:ferritin [Candidatus Ornithobacterium hominis]SZD71781.1 Ferritin [Candidatus Ornithobacterium hominis]
MSYKRISDEMENLLNKQVTKEAEAAQVFLAYGSWADTMSFGGVAEFFYKHATEERDHMKKIISYINTRGGKTKIEAIPAPPANPKNLKDCLEKALEHEIQNSKAIDRIVDLALEEKDWATFNFAQWFVEEQIEEEALINDLIDKYNLATEADENNANLYDLDKDLKSAPQHISTPREH